MRILAAIPLILLGGSTLIALRQAYAVKRRVGDDFLLTTITITGSVLILLGLSCLVTPFLMPIVLVIVAMAVAKHREGERRALLCSLSVAAKRGLPLADSVRAFAAWRSDEMARRAVLLADALDAGMHLPDALRQSGNPLPADAAMMVQLGSNEFARANRVSSGGKAPSRLASPFAVDPTTSAPGSTIAPSSPKALANDHLATEPAAAELTSESVEGSRSAPTAAANHPSPVRYFLGLQYAAQDENLNDEAWRSVFEQILYLLIVTQVSVLITGFIIIKIIPTVKEIFRDFGAELPQVTQLMISVSNGLAMFGFVLSPLLVCAAGVLLVAIFFYARGKVWIPWPLSKVFGHSETPSVLRGLAVCLEQGLPIPDALQQVGEAFPNQHYGIRLLTAAHTASSGGDWLDSLRYEKVITQGQFAVLQMALKTRSFVWTLRELANVSDQNRVYRAKMVLHVLTPLCLLCIAAFVALIAFGCMAPLVSLIQNLT